MNKYLNYSTYAPYVIDQLPNRLLITLSFNLYIYSNLIMLLFVISNL